jgi:hypothetical protein
MITPFSFSAGKHSCLARLWPRGCGLEALEAHPRCRNNLVSFYSPPLSPDASLPETYPTLTGLPTSISMRSKARHSSGLPPMIAASASRIPDISRGGGGDGAAGAIGVAAAAAGAGEGVAERVTAAIAICGGNRLTP